MSLKKFFTKHAGELGGIASVLGAVVHALPIDRQDKRRLGKVVDGLGDAAESIAESAREMSNVDVTLDKKLIREVLEEMLPDLLGAIAEKVFEIADKNDGGAPAIRPKQRRRSRAKSE